MVSKSRVEGNQFYRLKNGIPSRAQLPFAGPLPSATHLHTHTSHALGDRVCWLCTYELHSALRT